VPTAAPIDPRPKPEGGWRKKRKTPTREMGLVRITVDLPEAQHKRLKIAALNGGITLRQLILELLEREGITDR